MLSITRGDTLRRTYLLTETSYESAVQLGYVGTYQEWLDTTAVFTNLTGYTAKFYIRDKNKTLLHASTTENNEITITPLDGKVEVVIPDTYTKAFPVTRVGSEHKFDLELTDSLGYVSTYDRNTLEVLEDQSYD